MDDSTVIALAGVNTGGVVALFGPRFTAQANFRGERTLRDRDELRSRLDPVAETIDAAGRALDAAYRMLQEGGSAAAGLAGALRTASEAIRDLHFATARLSLHLDYDAAATQAARDCGDFLDELHKLLDVFVSAGRQLDANTRRAVKRLADQSLEANQRFLREAQAEIART